MLSKAHGVYTMYGECDACEEDAWCRKYYICKSCLTYICKNCNTIRFKLADGVFNTYLSSKMGFEDIDYPELCEMPFQLQSAPEIIVDDTGEGADQKQETVQFHESNPGMHVGEFCPEGAFITDDTIDDASLAAFLSRPVRIANFTWAESTTVGTTLQTINPYYLFFNDDRVKYKLNNFAYLRANLKVKILLNASPFYYGACIATYQPLQNFTPSTIPVTTDNRRLIPFSQRPHAWLLPQKNEGAEMSLPFIWPENWLTIRKAQDFIDMGVLSFIPYTFLQSANGVSAAGVSIQVYAWAEDVVLSGNTTSLALQSSPVDEYGVGAVSAPASAIAKVATYFEKIPIIGRWATATKLGAGAVSSIAKLFGFTNVPVITDVQPFRPAAMPQLATTEIGYPVEKLTLDSKNELSIDPTIIGLKGHDELAMNYLLTHDTYISSFTWGTNNNVDQQLWQCRVTPYQFDTLNNNTNTNVFYSPMAYVANMFQHWRGDIIFRFDFMTSPFHKGRVKIAYDPQGTTFLNITNSSNVSNVVYTEIVDLAVHTSFEMRIPYQQALPFLQLNNSNVLGNVPFQVSTGFTVQDGYDNGMLNVTVVNLLTAPVLTSNISVLVSVRGADNLEFANPTSVNNTTSNFVVQSSPVQEGTEPDEVDVTFHSVPGTAPATLDNARALVNFGEVVRSLRPMMRRLNFSHAISVPYSGAGVTALNYNFHKVPPYTGFDPNGMYTATAIVGSGTYNYNYARTIPVQWMLPCYLGYRGSFQWHFNPQMPFNGINHMSVNRTPWNQATNSFSITSTATSTTSKTISSYSYYNNIPDTNGGAALTNTIVQTGLSVQTPNYTNYLFQSSDPRNATAPTTVAGTSAYDGSSIDSYQFKLLSTAGKFPAATTGNTAVEVYCGIGTDFTPIFFLNAPVTYKQTPTPTPV